MKQASIPETLSARRALLCSLALTLGLVAGCGTAPDEPPATRAPDVGSVTQRFDQVLYPPYDPFDVPRAASCESPGHEQERARLLADSATEEPIRCSLTLKPDETIKRPIKFDGGSDGVVLDCQDQLRPRDAKGNMLVPKNGQMVPGSSVSRNGSDIEIISIRSDTVLVGDVYQKDPETGLYKGDRPENIVIQNCTIDGQTVIAGLSSSKRLAKASHDPQGIANDGKPSFVEREREIAPRNITFYRVKLIGKTSTPLYLNPGVSRFTMVESIVTGHSGEDPGIYLSPESTENTILNTRLDVTSDDGLRGREQIAVDGASYAFLVGNRVSGLDDGGYNLFRNCGEHGTIRYTTPSYNVIAENQFIYKNYYLGDASRNRYAVHLSSRNGAYSPRTNPYCDLDRRIPGAEPTFDQAGFPTYPVDTTFPKTVDTSYLTDFDNAHDNIVTRNEFLNRSPKSYIKNSSKLANFFAAGNHEVPKFSSGHKACYSPPSFGRVLLHGNSEVAYVPFDATGEPTCVKLTCNDGTLETVRDVTCVELGDPISIECRADGTNDGCGNFLSCPLGQRVRSVKAACNLEFGTVTSADLASVPAGHVKVVKASDKVSDGTCYVIGTTVSEGTKSVPVQQRYDMVESGWPVTIGLINGVRTVSVGCKEKDSNGGDCHVKAEFTCE